MELKRCQWPGQDPLYLAYHDEEWGVPLHEDNRLFEMIVLESMQSGLSWITILRKREAFRVAFHGFDPRRVATFGPKKIEKLLLNPDIIRNRAKLRRQSPTPVRRSRSRRNTGAWILFCGESWRANRPLTAGVITAK